MGGTGSEEETGGSNAGGAAEAGGSVGQPGTDAGGGESGATVGGNGGKVTVPGADAGADVGIPLSPIDLPRALRAQPETYARLVGFPEGVSWRKDGSVLVCQPMLSRIAPDKKRTRLLGFNCLGSVVMGDGALLITGQAGLYRVAPDGKVAILAEATGANDLSVDRMGAVFFTAAGSVHRYLPDGQHHTLTGNIGANGIEVDPDSRFVYVTRPGMNTVNRFALPANATTTVQSAPYLTNVPFPDGAAFDAHGNLWLALHQAKQIGIYDVVSKKELGRIPVPVETTVQNLAFGGAAFDQLFVVGGNYDANAMIVRFAVGVAGFPTNPGATAYVPLRMLADTVNEVAF